MKIATRDIGVRTAQLLREPATEARRVVELQGGQVTGYDEVAAVLAESLVVLNAAIVSADVIPTDRRFWSGVKAMYH